MALSERLWENSERLEKKMLIQHKDSNKIQKVLCHLQKGNQ